VPLTYKCRNRRRQILVGLSYCTYNTIFFKIQFELYYIIYILSILFVFYYLRII
jgi:hypothetical protein